MGKRKHGRAARNARKAALGIPTLFKGKKSKKFEKVTEKKEEGKASKTEQRIADEKILQEELAQQPHSMIVHSGKVGRYVKRLERDFREVMQPNTAMKLKVTKTNNFKDFIVNAPVLGVTHLACFTRTEDSVNLRVLRSPQGPTAHFKVLQYSLSRDVRRQQKRLVIFEKIFQNSPLLVLNGFNNPEKKQLSVVKTMIQNMFPALNIDKVQLADVRRAVLVNYDNDSDTMEFRHYSIKTVPSGMTKSTKKIVQGKVPDLSKYEDISEFFLNPGVLSESEWEFEQAEVDLPQDLKTRGCRQGGKTKVRMMEIGPRMTLKLTKIQDGLDDGDVLYHAFVKKTPAEIAEIKQRIPAIKNKKKKMEKDIEHKVIRKLTRIQDAKKAEEEEFKELKEKLIRKQKAVTGDDNDSDQEARKKLEEEKHQNASQKNQAPLPERKRKSTPEDPGKKKILKKKK